MFDFTDEMGDEVKDGAYECETHKSETLRDSMGEVPSRTMREGDSLRHTPTHTCTDTLRMTHSEKEMLRKREKRRDTQMYRD